MKLKQSTRALKRNKLFFVGMLLFDFLFFLAILQLHFLFLTPATQKVVELTRMMQEQLASSEQLLGFGKVLAGNAEFMGLYRDVLVLLFEFLVLVFVAWIIFKSFAWFFSHRSFHKGVPFVLYVRKFSLLSLFWFGVLLVSLFVAAAGGVVVFVSLGLIAAYFAQVQFALIPAKDTFRRGFRVGVKQAKRLVQVFGVNVLLVGLVLGLAVWASSVSAIAGVILFIAVFLPVLAFARFHMIVAVWSKAV